MARTNDDALVFCRMVLAEHKKYWSDKQGELKRYKRAYETRFWADHKFDDTMLRVETSDAFQYVESFISSFFARQPAVVIGADIAATGGNPKLAQAAANRFLYNQREQIEIAARLGLIYDYAALKLSPRLSTEMLDKVTIKAVPCWEVVVDRDATGSDDQRFIGHNYFITVAQAKQIWGNRKYTAVPKQDYFTSDDKGRTPRSNTQLPDDYLYIEILELYDFVNDEVYFFSPNYHSGEKFLMKETIPVRTYDDNPLSPIVPLYFSRVPSRPFEGLSPLSRVYDQIYEKNVLRTYWANAVRRDSRQYLYKEGVIDEEALAKITAGIDGAMIGVDNDTLDGVIRPVGVEPISTDFERYAGQIEADLSRSSVLAPFNSGKASGATATEITALAQYSASEIGKMARERDAAVENIINIYIRQLVLLADEGETAVLDVEGTAKVLTSDDLEGKFRINALDQGSTPLSDAIRKQNLISLLPTLQGLGVSPKSVLEEIVRNYELPKSFLEVAEVAAPAPGPSAADIKTIEGGPTGQMTGADKIAQALGGA